MLIRIPDKKSVSKKNLSRISSESREAIQW